MKSNLVRIGGRVRRLEGAASAGAFAAYLAAACGMVDGAVVRDGASDSARVAMSASCHGWRSDRNATLEADPSLSFDPRSLLIMFERDADEATVLKAIGGEELERWALVPGLVHVSTTLPVDQAVEVAVKIGGGGVRYAEPDYVVRTNLVPNDPGLSQLWGLRNTGQAVNGDPGVAGVDIRAAAAWDVTTGSSAVVIAGIDTGIRRTHRDLSPNMWRNAGEIPGNNIDDDRNGRIDDVSGWNFLAGNNDPSDDNGHGTHTAGTFAARGNDGIGVAGVAWGCRIMPLKFLNGSGMGFISGAIGSLDYAVRMGARVSNNSWGGGSYSQSLADSIASARNAGHLFVAAAGNTATDNDVAPQYPASYALDNVISVAALDNDGALAGFSCFGRSSVDIAAPGQQVFSATANDDGAYAFLSGTSMAAPHVAGAVALVWSASPELTMAEVRERILSSARPLPALGGRIVTGGMLDAAAALRSSTTNVRVVRGVADNFSRSNGTEATSPRSSLSAAARSFFGLPLIPFDAYPGSGTGANVIFADSFGSLPSGIRSATLAIKVRAGAGGSEGDTIRLGFASSSSSSQIASFHSVSIGAAAGRTWSQGQSATITLNLGAVRTASGSVVNLLPQLNSRGYLDVVVVDDSGVDFMQLDLVRGQ